jgi:hypothetical protein
MKIKLSELRKVIKSVISEGFYLKNPKTGVLSKKYPTKAAADEANMFLRHQVVDDSQIATPQTPVTRLAPASAEDVKSSTKDFYKVVKAREMTGEPVKFDPRGEVAAKTLVDAEAAAFEQDHEREAEFWMDSRAAGQSTEDAYADLDYQEKHDAFRKKLGMR